MTEQEQQIKRSFFSSLAIPFGLVVIMWLVKLVELNFDSSFAQYGNWPRDVRGLVGIFLMPFIHGDVGHLSSNSVPLLVLGGFLFYSYREVALKVLFWVYLIGGVWLWIGGRTGSPHIGASGVVYGLAAFLFFSGFIRRHFQLMALSMLVVFLYGGIIWYVFPIELRISWEGHLFGGIAGAICAWYYRGEGLQRKVYDWELEEDDDDDEWYPQENVEEKKEQANQVKITYIYRPKPPETNGKGQE